MLGDLVLADKIGDSCHDDRYGLLFLLVKGRGGGSGGHCGNGLAAENPCP